MLPISGDPQEGSGLYQEVAGSQYVGGKERSHTDVTQVHFNCFVNLIVPLLDQENCNIRVTDQMISPFDIRIPVSIINMFLRD